jgi:porin
MNQFATINLRFRKPHGCRHFDSVPIKSDWAIYGIIDQLLWRVPGSKDAKGIGLFGRMIGAPTEQNLVDFYADGGVTFSGMIPHRADDILGIGFAYTGISNDVHGLDVGSGLPSTRGHEALLEICYTAQLNAGWTLQPDFQYIWQPGRRRPSRHRLRGRSQNAAVLGFGRPSISASRLTSAAQPDNFASLLLGRLAQPGMVLGCFCRGPVA